jgi:hypothetical protein
MKTRPHGTFTTCLHMAQLTTITTSTCGTFFAKTKCHFFLLLGCCTHTTKFLLTLKLGQLIQSTKMQCISKRPFLYQSVTCIFFTRCLFSSSFITSVDSTLIRIRCVFARHINQLTRVSSPQLLAVDADKCE